MTMHGVLFRELRPPAVVGRVVGAGCGKKGHYMGGNGRNRSENCDYFERTPRPTFHGQLGNVIHRHGELERHGPDLLAGREGVGPRGQRELGLQQVVRPPLAPLEGPRQHLVPLAELHRLQILPPLLQLGRHAQCALGHGAVQRHPRRGEFGIEVRLELHPHHDLAALDFVHGEGHPEGRLELLCRSVVHHGKLPLGRHQRQRALGVELINVDGLVEVAVVEVHPHAFEGPHLGGHPHREVVVQLDLDRGVARKKALHVDGPVDLRVLDVSARVKG
mmetsp:Transcript_19660/g.62524  ORF Transcript_19660/g.62524 Transcript_19660/m.62524 type:complete len:276 (-) Transcript_19660:933-1760(-)